MKKELREATAEVEAELKKDAQDIRQEQILAVEEAVKETLGDLEMSESPDEPEIFH